MKKNLIVGLLLILATARTEAQDLIKMVNQDTMSINLNNSNLACLLSDAKLAERKDVLQKEIFSRVKKVEEVDDGYLFHFDDVEKLLPKLFHYILAEKECCPFFQQDISIGSNNSGITWKVSGNSGVKEILSQLLEEIEFPEN